MNHESVSNHTYKKYSGAKVGSISTTPLSKSSNAYSILRNTQNQVFYNPDIDMIGFIHRQNVNDWGGTPTASSNGVLRLDVSIDGGATFNLDMSDNGLNPLPNPSYCRYPQVVLYNPTNNTDPCSTKVIWNGATTSGAGWVGYVNGVGENFSDPNVCSTFSSTENYLNSNSTLIPSSLTEGLSNEYWMVDVYYNHLSQKVKDSIIVSKGVLNGNVINWTQYNYHIPVLFGTDSNAMQATPIIAFSPNGMNGYIIQTGIKNTGAPYSYWIFCWSTTDGGATWNMTETNMSDTTNNPEWKIVNDSLKTFFSSDGITIDDSTKGIPFPLGMDMVVDYSGRPHICMSLVNMYEQDTIENLSYLIGGARKSIWNISSKDNGLSFTPYYISELNTWQGSFGSITCDNYEQSARDKDGYYIYHKWNDDTSSTSTDGTGMSPDLWTCCFYAYAPNTVANVVRDHTTGDANWDGKMYCSTIAPIVKLDGCGLYKNQLQVVFVELLTDDQNEVNYHYISDICVDVNDTIVSKENIKNVKYFNIYPNPNNGIFRLDVKLDKTDNINIQIFDIMNKEIYNKNFKNMSELLETINLSEYSNGIYILQLTTSDTLVKEKMLIQK